MLNEFVQYLAGKDDVRLVESESFFGCLLIAVKSGVDFVFSKKFLPFIVVYSCSSLIAVITFMFLCYPLSGPADYWLKTWENQKQLTKSNRT
jgi:hypothetical protein